MFNVKNQKNSICTEFFRYNIGVFTVTFYQFNVSLLNENIHLFKKNLTEATFEWYCKYILDFTNIIINVI